MSGALWVGMSGPGAALRLDLADPRDAVTGLAVGIMAAATRELVTTWRFADGTVKTLGPWTLTAITGGARAIYVPTATDIHDGPHVDIDLHVVLDGVRYDYASFREQVRDRP